MVEKGSASVSKSLLSSGMSELEIPFSCFFPPNHDIARLDEKPYESRTDDSTENTLYVLRAIYT